MTARGLRLVLLSLGAAGLAAALFFSCYERREVETPVARSREAIRNPYLAAGRLLGRMGHEVVTVEGAGRLDALPPRDGTLLLPVSRRTLSARRSQALLDWVAAGGHLVVVTYSVWSDPQRTPDPLLDPLGLQQLVHDGRLTPFDVRPPCACRPANGAAPTAPLPAADAPAGEPDAPPPPPPGVSGSLAAAFSPPVEWDEAEAAWPGRAEPLAVRFDRRFYWGDGAARSRWAVAGARGAHVLQLAHGAGAITALTDDLFLRNEHLGWGDHAELLVRLARSDDRDGPVWIVVSEDWPRLGAVLRVHATPALASLAVLVLAWLARVVPRFGPLRPAPTPERRRWMEHVEATGRFHWRDERGRALLAGARASLLRELERRRPAWAALAPGARAEQLAAAAGLDASRVAQVLAPEPLVDGEAGFVAWVADLERIRAAL